MNARQRNLPEALDHVLYEFWMLYVTKTRLCQGIPLGALHNVYLESFVIHARCIVEFFCDRDETRSKMKPWHFLPNYPCQPGRHKDLGRMHQEVAHLTYARKKPGEVRYWPVGEVASPLFSLALDFLRAIDSNNVLMSYSDNRARTEELIQKFEGEINTSNVPDAPVQTFGAGSIAPLATTSVPVSFGIYSERPSAKPGETHSP
jgi:hypothetical protein